MKVTIVTEYIKFGESFELRVDDRVLSVIECRLGRSLPEQLKVTILRYLEKG